MSDSFSPSDNFAVLQQAADWFAVLRSDDANEADRTRWRDWLEARPEHRSAWQRVEVIGAKFERLPTDTAGTILDAPGRARRRFVKTLALACLVGAGTWTAARRTRWREWIADYQTATGEIRDVTLADGTGVRLNTATAINADYNAAQRRIALITGELFVETAPDIVTPARPFIVETAHGRLRALGTRFAVRQENAEIRLAVYEGAVEIHLAPANSVPEVVRTGEQTRFSSDTVEPAQPTHEKNPAWTRGMLIADNMRLADLVSELSRYRRGYLGCAREVENLRVVGAFPLTDSDRVLATLANTLPVKVRTILPWWVTIEAR